MFPLLQSLLPIHFCYPPKSTAVEQPCVYIPLFSCFLEPLEILWTLELVIKSVFTTSLVLCKTGIHLSKKKRQVYFAQIASS